VDRNEERGEWLRKTKKKKVTVVEIGKKKWLAPRPTGMRPKATN
jgi:hypothetical protein